MLKEAHNSNSESDADFQPSDNTSSSSSPVSPSFIFDEPPATIVVVERLALGDGRVSVFTELRDDASDGGGVRTLYICIYIYACCLFV